MDLVALMDGAKALHGDAAAARKMALKRRIVDLLLLLLFLLVRVRVLLRAPMTDGRREERGGGRSFNTYRFM